jgi:hypothetical protein
MRRPNFIRTHSCQSATVSVQRVKERQQQPTHSLKRTSFGLHICWDLISKKRTRLHHNKNRQLPINRFVHSNANSSPRADICRSFAAFQLPRKKMKFGNPLCLALSLVCVLSLMGTPASACSCVQFTSCEAFGSANAVFVGRMAGGTIKRGERDANGVKISYEAGETTFAVEEIFKGVQGAEVKVNVLTLQGTSCEWEGLQRGARYLVYAYGEPNKLSIGSCSPTKRIDGAKDDLVFLRSLPAVGTGGRVYGQVGLDNGERTPPPLVGITIAIQDEAGKRAETVTNREGRYEFIGLKPGKYTVEPVWDEAYSVYQPKREALVSDRGCTTVNYWAEIDGRISGQVLDTKNRPAEISTRLIPFEAETKTFTKSGYCNTAGHFEITGVSPGLYLLYVEIETTTKEGTKKEPYYYPGVKSREQARVLKVERGQKLTGIEFQLPAEFAIQTITGRVVCPDGRPAARIEVVMGEERDKTEKPVGTQRIDHWMGTRTLTDEQGRFTVQGFKGLTYKIDARTQSVTPVGSKSEPRHAPPVRLKLEDDVSALELILSKEGLFEELTPSRKKTP